jgi:hypothetical protein
LETALPSYSNFASVHRPGRLHKLFAGKLQGAQADSDASLEELEAIILSTIVKRDNSTIDISAYNISANDFRALFDNVLKKASRTARRSHKQGIWRPTVDVIPCGVSL